MTLSGPGSSPRAASSRSQHRSAEYHPVQVDSGSVPRRRAGIFLNTERPPSAAEDTAERTKRLSHQASHFPGADPTTEPLHDERDSDKEDRSLSPRASFDLHNETPDSPRGRTRERVAAAEAYASGFRQNYTLGETSVELNSDCLRDRSPKRGAPRRKANDPGCCTQQLRMPIIELPLSSTASTASSNSTTPSELYASPFSGHRDTFALIQRGMRPAPEIPLEIGSSLKQYLDHAEYKALRLTCRNWYSALPQPKIPSSHRMPLELIREVYNHLLPLDFNSIRHACHAWFLASLDQRLLTTMLKAGGWWRAAQLDLEHRESRLRWQAGQHEGSQIGDNVESEEWTLSKRLNTECTLTPKWKYNGLVDHSDQRMAIASVIEYSELAGCREDQYRGPATNLAISGCGKYALICEGCIVYVYSLTDPSFGPHEPAMKAVTSIMCPRRVLAVSMDTSSQRFAIAALLEGRMGLVCDIQLSADGSFAQKPSERNASIAVKLAGSSGKAQGKKSMRLPLRRAEVMSSSAYGQNIMSDPPSAFIAAAAPESKFALRKDRSESLEQRILGSGITVESGPRSVYRNLCSLEDPPSSVAICPQRRCVAFGCRAGIELHWVDALTGQDLNRWFPLGAPSDYLYFLPPRRGVDSAKKLRLISSAAGPARRSQVAGERRPHSRRQTITRLFFGNISFPTSASVAGLSSMDASGGGRSRQSGLLKAVDCDHYRALPLSDGAHMLFIDPETNNLCMGSDAPLGGPTKLLRKIICTVPGVTPAPFGPSVAPNCYAAGAELQWGVRIVAAYGSRIILFSIAADLFEELKTMMLTENIGALAESDFAHDLYLHTLDRSSAAAGNGTSPWSVKIEGMEIGRMGGVSDFSVDSSNRGLKIWAFSSVGEAVVWTLSTVAPSAIIIGRTKVRSDGSVEILPPVDADGDVVMIETSEATARSHEDTRSKSELRVSFDGTSSFDLVPSPAEELTKCTEIDLDNATGVVVHETHVMHDHTSKRSAFRPTRCDSQAEIRETGEIAENPWTFGFKIPRGHTKPGRQAASGEWEIDYLGVGLGFRTAAGSEDSIDIHDAAGRLECEILC